MSPADYLGLVLDSPVSSVSDPNVSGMSDNKEKKEQASGKNKLDARSPQKGNTEGIVCPFPFCIGWLC